SRPTMRPSVWLVAPLLFAAISARAELRLPVVWPDAEAVRTPAYRGDRIELRLRSDAAARARNADAAARARDTDATSSTARPGHQATSALRSTLGVSVIDAVAARLGIEAFESEFPGERVPAWPGASDFTAFYLAHVPRGV